MSMDTWLHCVGCGEDWPANAFTASGSAYRGGRKARLCSACYLEKHPRRETTCTDCGVLMGTRGQTEPATCRGCRQAIAAGLPIQRPTCRVCHRDCRGVRMSAGACGTCRQREWRAKNEVNGKQRLGAWTQAA